jgi:IS5 family transposase
VGEERRQILLGYKLHAKLDIAYGLIRKLKTTIAAAHDSRARLASYRDQTCPGVKAKGDAATMEQTSGAEAFSRHLVSAAGSAERRRNLGRKES